MRSVRPSVSVIVVNYRGTERTVACLRALTEAVDYPADRLHLVCVDNSGEDARLAGRVEALGGTYVRAPDNLGFAGGVNLGARHATGSVLALLNNDARPHRDWITAAVDVLRADPTVAVVASKVLDDAGEKVDFVDAGLTWFGMGYSRGAGEPATEDDAARDVLFATGSAMFVRSGVFAELGGFDERFFMFYEDVDLGWRANLRGWRVRFEPGSVAYHAHHASVSEVDGADGARELYLLERNALAALYKNLSDETLAKVLPAALALAVRRGTARGELDPGALDMRRGGGAAESTSMTVPRVALAGVLAIDSFVELLPGLDASRALEQAARRRTDADLVALMRKAIEPAYPLPRYLEAHDVLVEVFGIDGIFGRPRKVLVITGDAISDRMAGPAIRAWHTAEVLSIEHDTRLVTVNPHCEPPASGFAVQHAPRRDLQSHVDWADVVVLQGHVLEMVPALKHRDSTKIVVCDLYDPMHLELLEQGRELTDDRRADDVVGVTKVLNNQLLRGDFFLCASQRQRHFWLGHLAATGRLTPGLYDADPTMRSLIDEVPFGLGAGRPRRTGPGIRGVPDGVSGEVAISESDKVILWAGGVYNWFDPLTLIRAVDTLRTRRPDVRLVFLGMRHPNPEVPDMGVAGQSRHLAASLGLTGKHVFFNEGWVPYTQRQNWLLDADCGVTTHFDHVETTFAFRTRVLDYLWAGLPIVTTDGDSFADLVRTEKLGVVVPPSNADALADALERVLYDPEFAVECERRIAEVRERFTWETALAPLLRFCRDPRPAADRLPGSAPLVSADPLGRRAKVLRDVGLLREYLADGGGTEVARRALGRVRRLVGERLGKRRGA